MTMPFIKTEVKVVRIGSHGIESASGITDILWKLDVNTNANLDGLEIKLNVPPQAIHINFERWNDDTDQVEKFNQTINIGHIKLETGSQEYSDFIKNLQNGLKPKELELWRDSVTLSF